MLETPPLQEQEPRQWFLEMEDGRPLPITDGLLIGKNQGRPYQVGLEVTSPLLRFECQGDGLLLSTTSHTWALADRKRMLGPRHAVNGAADVQLPDGSLRIRRAGASDDAPEYLTVFKRQSLRWLNPAGSHPARPENVSSAGDARPEPILADDRPEPVNAAGNASPSATKSPSSDDHLHQAGQAAGTAPVEEPVARQDPAPVRRERPESQRPPIRASTPPYRQTTQPPPGRLDPDLALRPLRARPPTSKASSVSYRAVNEPRWSVTLLTIVVYLGGLVFSTPVQAPMLPEERQLVLGTGTPSEDALLETAEQLLRERPGPATLEFALGAYRAAAANLPDRPELRRRLAELDSYRAAR